MNRVRGLSTPHRDNWSGDRSAEKSRWDVPILKRQEFANQIELHRYAELNDLAYAWAYTRAFGRWEQLLTPEEYKLVDVWTSQGTIRAMLFPKVTRAEQEEQEMATARELIQRKRTAASPGVNPGR
jgi:hypothetical protein